MNAETVVKAGQGANFHRARPAPKDQVPACKLQYFGRLGTCRDDHNIGEFAEYCHNYLKTLAKLSQLSQLR
ncbi:MAG: hypothetical protein KDA53_16440 [Hyphomonas sp.]|nr:hypothetical protein [Hyphomonas sp.]